MMTKLREMTFVFIWILVFAFVGLMVFEWGMDITGIKGRSNVVGTIDGQKVTIQEFQQAMQNAYMQEKQMTGQEPDEEKMQELRDRVWEMFVQRVLLGREIKRMGITVTNREIYLNLTQNPPQELRQNPSFQTDGKFDMSKYQQALQNPQANWLPIENYYRETLPFQKLQDLVTNSVIVTQEEVKAAYLNQSLKAKIQYLEIPAAAFHKEDINVSDTEIQNYYNAHKEDYKVEAKRQLNYVLFSTEPSAADSARVYQLAQDVMKDAKSGISFSELADEFSEDPSVKSNHGDLGYFERDRMVKPFADAAFSAKPGEIVGPVKTQFGLHIIKVIDKKKENGKEMVHAAHILLKFTASTVTTQNAQKAADNFEAAAKEDGWQATATESHQNVQETPPITKSGYIPGIGNLPSTVRWAFDSKENAISPVYRSPQGYVVFEVSKVLPEHFQDLSEVKEIITSKIVLQKQLDLAHKYAEKIGAEVENKIPFATIAKTDSAQIVKADSTAMFSKGQPIPKIGMAPAVKAAAFTLPIDEPSGILESDRGFYFIIVEQRTDFNQEQFNQQSAMLRNRLLVQKKQQFFANWYEELKKKANIEDNRNRFFSA